MAIKINLVVRLQHWMDSVPGQTFLNYAYSWGAAIVILGALFKLTHLPGGNLMLFIGMGTEVIVFFLSAFDRPFDKTEIGKELPNDYETDEEIARRLGLEDEEEEEDQTEEETEDAPQGAGKATQGATVILAANGSNTTAEPSRPNWRRPRRLTSDNSGRWPTHLPKWTNKARASHATAKRWTTSTALSRVSTRSTSYISKASACK